MPTSATSTSNLPASPTFTATSSSFDMVSYRSRSSTMSSQSLPTSSDDSDDEIVWTVSEDSLSSSDLSNQSMFRVSDDDFVLLSRPRSPVTRTGCSAPSATDCSRTTNTVDVTSGLERLALNQMSSSIRRNNKAAKERCNTGSTSNASVKAKAQTATRSECVKRNRKQIAATRAHSNPSPAPSPHVEPPLSTATLTRAPLSSMAAAQAKAAKPKPRRGKKMVARGTGFGARPIVDDISEIVDGVSDKGDEPPVTSMYEEAVKYITSFLSNPTDKDSVCRLTLLQSLIIELGIASSSLPDSLTSAKAMLKSRAFLNIREYLAVRDQGHAAVQRVMHPSRNALIKDIRAKRNPASLKWVKQNGLQVLLVSCYH